MQLKAPLKGHEWDCSTHASKTQNMAKRALDRVKADLKTYKIEPETLLHIMQNGAPLEGQHS